MSDQREVLHVGFCLSWKLFDAQSASPVSRPTQQHWISDKRACHARPIEYHHSMLLGGYKAMHKQLPL